MNNITDSIIIFIKVITNSSSNKLSNFNTDKDGNVILKAYLTASPEKGKANASLIDLLSKMLKIKKSNIEIIRGHTSNKKILSLSGIMLKELQEIFDKI